MDFRESPEHRAFNMRHHGRVRVELLDRTHGPGRDDHLAGYGLDDCDPIRADDYAHVVTWQGDPDLSETASSAKAFCSDAVFHCAAENIQIHGGIGFTWEHPAHMYFKRAKSSEMLFGAPPLHRERVAQLMGL